MRPAPIVAMRTGWEAGAVGWTVAASVSDMGALQCRGRVEVEAN